MYEDLFIVMYEDSMQFSNTSSSDTRPVRAALMTDLDSQVSSARPQLFCNTYIQIVCKLLCFLPAQPLVPFVVLCREWTATARQVPVPSSLRYLRASKL